jgi:prepilin-type N-terminal cleavage/methylation domain-containing protein
MMKKMIKREAFTLIELIMVIVVLGIVAMIGTDIIAKMYHGYLRSQIVNQLQQQTELALDEIAKRLKFRIKDSVITKNSQNPSSFKPLAENNNSTSYDMLEWIGYDNEGFVGEYNATINGIVPGWSGFVDLRNQGSSDETNMSQISTKGSHLTFANNSIKALSYGAVDMTNPTKDKPAVVFKFNDLSTPTSYGLNPNSNDHNNTYPVTMKSETVLEFVEGDFNKTIIEQYYLCWSAYALVPDAHGANDDFNLTFHYNYQPWQSFGGSHEKFNDANTSKVVIAEHVSTFKFTQSGNSVQIKLCIQDGNKTGIPIGFCKEKAIF